MLKLLRHIGIVVPASLQELGDALDEALTLTREQRQATTPVNPQIQAHKSR